MRGLLFATAAALVCMPAAAQEKSDEVSFELNESVAQLRHVIGKWDVKTTFYRADGHASRALDGTYSFEWVVPDKVIKGMSAIPELEMASGLLFYVREATSEIEMTSVGPDGALWVMTGPLGSEVRETPVAIMPDGSTLKLRFTRFNVSPDRFESKMERSTDGGQSWVQGNHQLFVRRVPNPSDAVDALRPLAGACWRGTFGNGPAYDVMCVEEMAGGFLKSRHMVRGIDGSYSGETIYFTDPVSGEARFTYYTSLGAVQNGRIAVEDGKVVFDDIVHIARDGGELRFRGTGELLPEGRYRSTTSQLKGAEWQEPSEIVFDKTDCASWSEVERGCD